MRKILVPFFIVIMLCGAGYFVYSTLIVPKIPTSNVGDSIEIRNAKEFILKQESPLRKVRSDLYGYAGKVVSKKEDSLVVGTNKNQVNVTIVTNNTKVGKSPLISTEADPKIEESGLYNSSMLKEGDFVDVLGTYDAATNTIAAIFVGIYSIL
jgi:hypothetical protein